MERMADLEEEEMKWILLLSGFWCELSQMQQRPFWLRQPSRFDSCTKDHIISKPMKIDSSKEYWNLRASPISCHINIIHLLEYISKCTSRKVTYIHYPLDGISTWEGYFCLQLISTYSGSKGKKSMFEVFSTASVRTSTIASNYWRKENRILPSAVDINQ